MGMGLGILSYSKRGRLRRLTGERSRTDNTVRTQKYAEISLPEGVFARRFIYITHKIRKEGEKRLHRRIDPVPSWRGMVCWRSFGGLFSKQPMALGTKVNEGMVVWYGRPGNLRAIK